MWNKENNEAFQNICGELLSTVWACSPVQDTILGIDMYSDTLGDTTSAGYEALGRKFGGIVSALESDVAPSSLNAEELVEYRVAMSMASSHQIWLESVRSWALDPGQYLSLCVWGCFSLLLRDFAPKEERLRHMISRMREIPSVLQSARDNLLNPPSIYVSIARDILVGVIGFFNKTIPRLAEQYPEFRDDLQLANHLVVRSLESYGRWLADDLVPRANGDFAIGKPAYQQLLFCEGQLTYSPGELVKIAEGIISDTVRQLEDTANGIDRGVPWYELVQRLESVHLDGEELLDAYRDATAQARQFVIDHDLVTIPDDESLEVGETPEFERAVLPYGGYFPPPAFGTNKNACLWVTAIESSSSGEPKPAGLSGHCTYTIPVTAVHEGYPGHHVQFCRLVDLKSKLAKQTMNPITIEGWSLYCEQIMREQGYLSDQRTHLFQLRDLLLRSCRVIVDVGLHTEGMSSDEAVRILVDKVHLDEESARVEVNRSALMPTQPMSYLIGRMLILDLRERMRMRMAAKFSLKTFHDGLLSYGGIPIPLISRCLLESCSESARQDEKGLAA